MTEEPPRDQAAEKALDDLAAALRRAADAINAAPNPLAGFAAARRLVRMLSDAVEMAARLHAHAAARVHRAESLSLAGLAQRLGMSKARADQLIKTAKKEGETDG